MLMMITNLAFAYGADKCDDIPNINFTKPLREQSPPFDVGTKLTFECKAGYVNSGKRTTAECVLSNANAIWNISNTCIAVSCPFPGEVVNAVRNGDLFTYPHNVTYKCNSGYKMKGIAVLYCSPNSHWSSPLPECRIVSCPVPRDIDNGDVSYSTVTYKSEVNYNCKKGFVLDGPNKRRCQENETWSGSEPKCLEVTCPKPQKIPGGYYVSFKTESAGKYSEGDVIIYYCNNSNEQVITRCLGGMWSSLPPKCAVDPSFTIITLKPTVITEETSIPDFGCSNIPNIEHGNYVIGNDNTVSYNCEKGYKIKGSKMLKCLSSGKWDSTAPICESGKLPIGYILAIVFGVTAIIAIVIGVSIYFAKRRKSPSPIKPSKASLNDAVNFEELQKLEKNHRPIPVTVL